MVRDLGHIDFVCAFLNAELRGEIFMDIPDGLKEYLTSKGDLSDQTGMCCQLLRSLYGLKQSSLRWNETLHDYLVVKLKFNRSTVDPCLYWRYIDDESCFNFSICG